MTSRARDVGRQYFSSSTKRKAKEDKLKKEQAVIEKIPKLSNFFQKQPTAPPLVDICAEQSTSTSQIAKDTEKSSQRIKDSPLKVDSSNVIQEDLQDLCDAYNNFSTDIGKWSLKLNAHEQEYWIGKGSQECQNINDDFKLSEKYYENDKKVRHCQISYFFKIHKLTQTKQERNWLCYSPSKGKLYCFPCKVMNSDESSALTQEGFNDRKNTNLSLNRHEESSLHKKTIIIVSAKKKRGTY